MAHSALFELIKLRNLMRDLKLPRPYVIGHLECLAYYVAAHNVDGDISNLADEEIEMAAEWEGEPGLFVRSAIARRFIDRDDRGTRIHDWEDWAPDWVKKRIKRMRDRHELPPAAGGFVPRETADDGGQRQPSADSGGQRRTTAGQSRAEASREEQSNSVVVHTTAESESLESAHPQVGRGAGEGAAHPSRSVLSSAMKGSASAVGSDSDSDGRTRRLEKRYREAVNLLSLRMPQDWGRQPVRMKAADLVTACDPSDKDTGFPTAVGAYCSRVPGAYETLYELVLECLSRKRDNPRGWLREALRRKEITV